VRRTEPEVHDGYAVRLVGMAKHLGGYANSEHLTPSTVKASWTVLEALGFGDYLESMVPPIIVLSATVGEAEVLNDVSISSLISDITLYLFF